MLSDKVSLQGARITVQGVVQGVGFRPFVYGAARALQLNGWVRNTAEGVQIDVDGPEEAIQTLINRLRDQAPPLARVDRVDVAWGKVNGHNGFEILASQDQPLAFLPVTPDAGICQDCLRELLDPHDPRYRYPFINCTNCGPRFTILRDIPYDRPNTTMAAFRMCRMCAREYHDPGNRRFHAQPVACPKCGPQVWLEVLKPLERPGNPNSKDGQRPVARNDQAIRSTRDLLAQGSIVAIKGLGGFHLACDATNPGAVSELRRRKLRVDKPYAVMLPDLETVKRHCRLSQAGEELLTSPARPIVILERQPDSNIAPEVAPHLATLGVMLPYTPLHHLLLEPEAGFPPALVMTSGNLSEEPIVTENRAARERLARIADAFLLHDRDIHQRCDDSLVRTFAGRIYPVRRARGYAPDPIRLPWRASPLLALGGELKNTFCLTRDGYAFLSHHIGDLENFETLQSFEEAVGHYERLFRIRPQALACDRHPDYLATRYAYERSEREGLPVLEVQHHHGHIAALMAEHGLSIDERVIGVAFDGTGYGLDGEIWGGEFLIAGYHGFERPCHLVYTPLPGGEAAIREPWRMALAWLRQAGLAWDTALPSVAAATRNELSVVDRLLETRINTPLTSSVGRLFDAVAALIGVRQRSNYEAQAAIELEACVDPRERGAYPVDFRPGVADPIPMIVALTKDLRSGTSRGVMAARFHNGLADLVLAVCCRLRDRHGLGKVALSGGVWQNYTLLTRTTARLEKAGFQVLVHHQVPANDGGLSLGQAVVALARQMDL